MKKFKCTSTTLLERANTINGHLETDLSDFTSFDPGLNPDKKKLFGEYIFEAKAANPDRVVRSVLSNKTEELNMIMKGGQ